MAVDRARVLVVDDDPSTLATYGRIVSLDGYDVAMVSSAREALALLPSRSFDLVLTDHRMPEVSGLELLAEIHGLPAPVRVVLYAAFGSHTLETADVPVLSWTTLTILATRCRYCWD